MVYHISSSKGADSNNGLSPESPWKSFTCLASIQLCPGDKLLLECGGVWEETLEPSGSGTADSPILITSYGTGARPHIKKAVSDKADRCIYFKDICGYKISGLELSGARYGVEIQMNRAISKIWTYYHFEDCYFHDIVNTAFPHSQKNGGDLSGWPWAIYRTLNEASDTCVLSDLSVVHCFSQRCQGFYSTQYAEGGSGTGNIAEVNTRFEGNTFQYCHYNNIYFSNVTNGTIKDCVLVYAYPNKNEWPYGNTLVISGSPRNGYTTGGLRIDGNEFGWAGDIPGGADGCFYDFEYSQTDTQITNNLFHDAFGEGFLIMGYAQIDKMRFENNITRDICLYCTNRNMAFDIFNSNGTGIFKDNKFFLSEGQTAFSQKPSGYIFENNHEAATGEFCKMPMVTKIETAPEKRIYTFSCATPHAQIRYTTDGSLPKKTSPVYRHPITVTRSAPINVKAFCEGMYDSYTNSIIADFEQKEGGLPCTDLSGIRDNFTYTELCRASGGCYTVCSGDTVLLEQTNIPTESVITVVFRNGQPHLFVDGIYKKAGRKSTTAVSPPVSAATVFDYPLTHAEVQVLGRKGYEG